MRRLRSKRTDARDWRVLHRRWAGQHDWATRMVRDWAAKTILRYAHPLLRRPMQPIACQVLLRTEAEAKS